MKKLFLTLISLFLIFPPFGYGGFSVDNPGGAGQILNGILGNRESKTAWVPTDIPGWTLMLWSDLGVTQGGGLVSIWADQSINEFNVTQSVDGLKPTYVAGVLNGLPVLRGDNGAKQCLLRANTDPADLFPNGDEGTWVLVLRETSGYDSYTVGIDTGLNQVTVLATLGGQIYFDFPYNGGAGRVHVAEPADWHEKFHILFLIRRSDGQTIIRCDEVNLLDNTASGTVASNPTATLGIFCHTVDVTFGGDIAAVLVNSNGISDVDAGLLETFLRAKYNL
jgi:hypothetical protein